MGDLDQLAVLVAGEFLEPAERVVLPQVRLLHQDPLGPLDHLAVLERLLQVGGLLAEGLELLEPAHRDGDRGLQVGLLDRLDEVGQDVVRLGAANELGVVVGRDEDDRDRAVPADLHRRVDPVHVGHLDVGDDQVRPQSATLFDQFAAVLGRGDDLVAEQGQDFPEVIAHVHFVVGDGDPQRSRHKFPRGNVSMKTAPG